VWIVADVDYDSFNVAAVFDRREDAEAVLDQLGNSIEEHWLYPPGTAPHPVEYWSASVTVQPDGQLRAIGGAPIDVPEVRHQRTMSSNQDWPPVHHWYENVYPSGDVYLLAERLTEAEALDAVNMRVADLRARQAAA
jgi:hypothetical protein